MIRRSGFGKSAETSTYSLPRFSIYVSFIALALAACVGSGVEQPSGASAPPAFSMIDVAGDVGLDVQHSAFKWATTMDPVAMMGGGVCWIDVDRDGWLDLFVTDTWANGEWGQWNEAGGLPTTRIFRNIEGVFTEYTGEWKAGYETRANGCVAADFDNDGFTDLYVTTDRTNLLLWNDEGGGFVDGSSDSGADAYGWHTGVAAGDLNGDGLVDLVVSGYADLNRPKPNVSTGFPNPFEAIPNLVLINNGSAEGRRPTFSSVANEMGMEPQGAEYGLGVTMIDVDNDGDLDVYIANDTQPNRLYLNMPSDDGFSDVVLSDVSESAGVADPNSGMGIAVSDVNGDAFPDLVVTNLAGQGHAALVSSGAESVGYSEGLQTIRALGDFETGWGTSFGDLNLDGNIDIVIASGAIPIRDLVADSRPLSIFLGFMDESGLSFEDASMAAGMEEVAARNGRGVALADYDNDGDLDAVVTAIGQPLALLENLAVGANWLIVDPGTPRPGMVLTARFADGTVQTRYATVGSSWLSSEDPRIHLGLGTASKVETIEVVEPNGMRHFFENVAANQILKIED